MMVIPRVRLLYDWIVLNSSAGNDSQTMVAVVVERCLAESAPLNRLVVAHADLGRVEWPGTRELAETQAKHYGVRFEVVKRPQGDLLQHIRERRKRLDERGQYNAPAWPSSTTRYCTSDHKRGQVKTLWTRLCRETRALSGRSRTKVRLLNCMGMRATESPARAKLLPFRLTEATSIRVVHTWLPLHAWSEAQVWQHIKARSVPYHHAYDLGMPRLSCAFCIFAPRSALLLAGKHNRDLLREYVAVEKEVRSTFKKGLALADILQDVERGVESGPVATWEM